MTTSANLTNEEFRDFIINQFHEDIGPVNDVTRLAYEIYYSKLSGKKERRQSLRMRNVSSNPDQFINQSGHRIVGDLSRRSTLNMLNANFRNTSDTVPHSFTRSSSFSKQLPQSRRYSEGIRREVTSSTVIPIFSDRNFRTQDSMLGETFQSYIESLSPIQIGIPIFIFIMIILIWLTTTGC
ncbi:uncharacterized protein LOC141857102 [Brevipalpus obovatus]|uniref:uncharacterized protein LOC141857102 n=1 Tax=Brevipalpus obovatus TaxID=246614 RepID=UPI003D9E1C81